MLVNITIGSAWNIVRHLQNLEAIVETAHPTNDDAAVEALATHTLKDVQAEIDGMKQSILIRTF
ncbi:hypothetical protein LCGC14_0430180 [marine sediment metagenome]|uniref:Uncharacterized protein n=1 Tax=marine sediment metagenome TaxID=412755 RepID=A0A0F9T6N7_9ZZZZ